MDFFLSCIFISLFLLFMGYLRGADVVNVQLISVHTLLIPTIVPKSNILMYIPYFGRKKIISVNLITMVGEGKLPLSFLGFPNKVLTQNKISCIVACVYSFLLMTKDTVGQIDP